MIVPLTLLTLLAMGAIVAVYQVSHALVGRGFGIEVEEVAVGIGPKILGWGGGHWQWSLRLFPFGGYTKFVSRVPGEDRTRREPGGWAFENVPIRSRLLTLAAGPFSMLPLAALLLGLPVWLGRPQMEVTTRAASMVSPCAVPGLRVKGRTTWRGQWRLAADTAGRWSWLVLTFGRMEGWGGPAGFAVTSAGVSRVSWAGYASGLGILCWWIFWINLLPVPPLCGGQVGMLLVEGLGGRPMEEGPAAVVNYTGFFAALVFVGRIVWIDARWLWRALV